MNQTFRKFRNRLETTKAVLRIKYPLWDDREVDDEAVRICTRINKATLETPTWEYDDSGVNPSVHVRD